MHVDTNTTIIFILIAGGITLMTRALPFFVFRKHTPKLIEYLGKVLPMCIMAILIVYCLRDVNLLNYPYGLPELISIICTIILHLLKRNNLISIASGTLLYMFLVQFVFI